MGDFGTIAGPLSRIICLGLMCGWAPLIVVLFAQTKLQAWFNRETSDNSTA